MKILLLWTCMCWFNLSYVVLGGMKYRPASYDTTWHPKSFGSEGVSLWLMSKCLPANVHVARYKLLHGIFFYSARVQCRWSLLFFIIGVMYGFRANLWEFSPNYLLRRLKTVPKLFAVRFKRKIAKIWGSLASRSICLTERSSRGLDFHARPDLSLPWNVPSALKLMIALCTAVWEQCNLAVMSFSVHPTPYIHLKINWGFDKYHGYISVGLRTFTFVHAVYIAPLKYNQSIQIMISPKYLLRISFLCQYFL